MIVVASLPDPTFAARLQYSCCFGQIFLKTVVLCSLSESLITIIYERQNLSKWSASWIPLRDNHHHQLYLHLILSCAIHIAVVLTCDELHAVRWFITYSSVESKAS